MGAAFVMTLREGLEAFLIVAISLAYLRKTGRHALIPAVRWGIAVSIALSAGAAWLLQRASNQALWEGILAIAAAFLVGSLTVHMWRMARKLKSQIEARLEGAAVRPDAAAFAGVFLFTVLMITREGMETALLLNSVLSQSGSGPVLAGVSAGLFAAAATAWLWSRHGHRVNLGLFFQVTAIFLGVFLVQLLIYGFHELTEAYALPFSESLTETLHWATEPYGPDGRYGQWLSFAIVVLPVGWLLMAWLRDRRLVAAGQTT